VDSGPAAGPNVPPGWYRVDNCDNVHTAACSVTVFWQVNALSSLSEY